MPGITRRVHLVLADQVVAIGVGVVDGAVDQLFDHLAVARRVAIVDQGSSWSARRPTDTDSRRSLYGRNY